MQIQARHYRTGNAVRVSVFGDIIGEVNASDQPTDNLPFIAPAFFDPQINGHGGIWFGDASTTPREVLAALKPQFAFGIGRLFPTLITASKEDLISGFTSIKRACDMEPWANELVAGCHLEGPYISPEDGPRGAHPAQHVRDADWSEFCEFQEASGNRIKLVTVAPEIGGAIDFIRKAVESGVTISIGHTGANSDQIAAAVEAGATMSTHLGNGAHQVLPRHPNYIWDQLAEPRLRPSLIADGFHLPESVIRCIIAAKGMGNTVLTSDASGLAGSDAGEYSLQGTPVRVTEDNRICLAEKPEFLAGSGVSLLNCVNNLVRAGITDLPDAIDMAGQTAANVLPVSQNSLEPRQRADFILFHSSSEQPVKIVGTVVAGAIRYNSL